MSINEWQFSSADGDHFHTSASFGALIADADYEQNLLRWIKVADEALYKAKDTGRNRVIIRDRIARASKS